MEHFLPEHLPDDLWARILVEVEGGVKNGVLLGFPYKKTKKTPLLSMVLSQSRFHQLRLVCHKFNNVFLSQRRLSRILILSPALTQESLPSLLAWQQQYGASVEIFAACCSPCVDAALSKLMPPRTALVKAFLSGCCNSTVSLMSGLISLTYCEIVSSGEGDHCVDRTPLKELASLQSLHLACGVFTATRLPANLTNLSLRRSFMHAGGAEYNFGSNKFVTSLRKLVVCDGVLNGLHPRGLLACSALVDLQLANCCIESAGLEDSVDLTNAIMPDLLVLTSLSRLQLQEQTSPHNYRDM